MKRRDFIQSSAALGALAAVGAVRSESEAKLKRVKVKSYRKLGKTDLKMSDISFGTGKRPASSLILRAIERGINYFDTAPDYGAGTSELFIGDALRKYKQRDKIQIASKFCSPVSYRKGASHLRLGSSKVDYKRAVEGSLRRMDTDYLDVVFVHAIGESREYEGERKRLLDDNMLSAAQDLREEGKVRYLAASSHGPHNMERLMMEAVRSGYFDLIMLAFNFMKFPEIPGVLKEAQARGVGVIAMKTLAGANDMDLDSKGAVFEHAAFKWVLQHPQVGGLVVTIKKVRDLNLYLQASGQAITATDRQMLERYAVLYGRDYCRTGCGDCEAGCPNDVPVAGILRYGMYFENYGQEKQAMHAYANLERDAENCLKCEDERCTMSCPYGLQVGLKLRAAHNTLSLGLS